MTPLADAAAVVLAAGTLSSLVTTPLWLRARHQAALLGREAAATAAENLARAAETRHLIDVRIPAMLARLTFPHLPVPGLLHPQFTGSPLEADHLALLAQVATVAAQAQPRADGPATAADWFEPRHRAPGAARTAPYLGQPAPRQPEPPVARPVPGWATPQPSARQEPAREKPVLQEPEPAPMEPAPPASGLRGSSAVWSAFQSGTESGRAAVEHRFADTRSGDGHHVESHHEGSL